MSSKTYDPETKKEYVHENEYDYRIQRFCELNQYVKHEEEVIDFAFSLRDELINDLENKDDAIRLKYIKWIEDEYLLRTKDFLITQNLHIPDRLIRFKSFSYENIDEHVLKEGGNDKKKNLLERVVSKWEAVKSQKEISKETEMKKSLLILFFTSVVFSQSILGTWQLQEQYKNNEVVTFKSYLKYEFSPPNVWRSYVGDYVDYGFFSIKEQSIVLKFDDGDAAKGTYSIKGDIVS